MLRLKQFLVLARLTSLEAARQPICLLLATTCLVLTGLGPVMLAHRFGEEGKFARDNGLALHLVFGFLIAAYAASNAVSQEMRSGTASTVLSKPVSRSVFLLSKYAGISWTIVMFSLCATCATLLSVRISEQLTLEGSRQGVFIDAHTAYRFFLAPACAYLVAAAVNYWGRRPFSALAFRLLCLFSVVVFLASACFDRGGALASFNFRVDWRIVPASVLVTMALLVLTAISVSLSTRLSTPSTLILCGGLLVGGLLSDHLWGTAALGSFAGILYRFMPNWQHFWVVDALMNQGTIPWTYVLHTGLYTLAYAGGALFIGVVSFRHAEMK